MTNQDPIASLLRATGRRPAAPPERSARVREATRLAWNAEIVRRRRSRRLTFALALAASVVLVVWTVRALRGTTSSMAPPRVVEVDRVANGVWAEHGWFPGLAKRWDLQARARVAPGATIRTSADGRAALHLLMHGPHGHALRLDHATSLRILSDRAFLLERGAVYVDSGTTVGSVRIETALGTIEDVGTQFEVRLNEGGLTVRVREGEVKVGAGSVSLRAAAGHAVTVDRAGRLARAAAAPEAGWAWTETVAPPFPIEGRSLADFLTWAARERGTRVRYLGAGLAQRATGVRLHGSVEGMTLDQAVASVAVTSGLVHRWQAGELVVREAP